MRATTTSSERTRRRALAALTALVLAACTGDDVPIASASSARPPSPSAAAAKLADARPELVARPRAEDAELARLRRALDFGRVDEARALMGTAGVLERAGDEAAELRARLAALDGRTLEALRLLEDARRERPSDPALHAALAEIYANAGKFETAWSELKRGDEAFAKAGADEGDARASSPASSAELARARGILWILREGGAEKGLDLLESARAADPELAFAERALAQAHLLVAKAHAKAEDLAAATEHVDRSLAFDAKDVDARRLSADLRAAAGDFTEALAILEGLVAEKEPLQGELALLYKKAAMGALLAKNRPLAIERFAKARSLGLTTAELGSGAAILEEEVRARVERGVAAYEKSDLDSAEKEFRAALELAPDEIRAQNHLGVVRFKRGDAVEAARLWRSVLATARAEAIELPEPVHVNLAKALVQSGDPEGARGARGPPRAGARGPLERRNAGDARRARREPLSGCTAGVRQRARDVRPRARLAPDPHRVTPGHVGPLGPVGARE